MYNHKKEMNELSDYESPQVEVLEVEVENGIAASFGGESGKEEWM